MTGAPSPRIRSATFVASADDTNALPAPVYAEVAFAGRSNVGKSSLINTLVGQHSLVRTSRTPGRTRTLVLFRVELAIGDAAATLDLVDLPGYGYAERSKQERRAWGPMIENFLRQRAGLRAVVVLVDVRRGLEAEERDLLTMLHDFRREAVLVATKVDKLPVSRRKLALAAVTRDAGLPVLGFSSVEGDGRDALWRILLQRAGLAPAGAEDTAPRPVRQR